MSNQEEIEVPEVPTNLINLTTAMEAVIGMGSIRLLGLTAAAWIAGYKAGHASCREEATKDGPTQSV